MFRDKRIYIVQGITFFHNRLSVGREWIKKVYLQENWKAPLVVYFQKDLAIHLTPNLPRNPDTVTLRNESIVWWTTYPHGRRKGGHETEWCQRHRVGLSCEGRDTTGCNWKHDGFCLFLYWDLYLLYKMKWDCGDGRRYEWYQSVYVISWIDINGWLSSFFMICLPVTTCWLDECFQMAFSSLFFFQKKSVTVLGFLFVFILTSCVMQSLCVWKMIGLGDGWNLKREFPTTNQLYQQEKKKTWNNFWLDCCGQSKFILKNSCNLFSWTFTLTSITLHLQTSITIKLSWVAQERDTHNASDFNVKLVSILLRELNNSYFKMAITFDQ